MVCKYARNSLHWFIDRFAGVGICIRIISKFNNTYMKRIMARYPISLPNSLTQPTMTILSYLHQYREAGLRLRLLRPLLPDSTVLQQHRPVSAPLLAAAAAPSQAVTPLHRTLLEREKGGVLQVVIFT